ncbi:energy transducer TonB [Leptospira perolatii]|uniref:Energy transducer TonB n=1 Tax=Leptospira perolatii TaxID=2023191 RepID=A0A2M9ZQV2_9LEPT|nr:TonB C-terminal domain-containing protein [Leptospira perolatii]PJZ68263.1 energy transducer TonB [Leptospira perolatii]PJZ74460.1 energy transducer TonB [Leptospira perolatii]
MKSSRKRRVVEWGVNFLSWISPFVGFGIFFPLGVLFAFPKNRNVRRTAFSSLILQVGILAILYPLELWLLFSEKGEEVLRAFLLPLTGFFSYLFLPPGSETLFNQGEHAGGAILFLFFWIGILLTFLQKRFVQHRVEGRAFHGNRSDPLISRFVYRLFAVLGALVFTHYIVFDDTSKVLMAPYSALQDAVWVFFPSLLAILGILSAGHPLVFFQNVWMQFSKQDRVSRASETGTGPSSLKKQRYSLARDLILPGWGHIYSGNLWRGFPILFIYLLVLLFFAAFFFSWLEPAFGIRYLFSLGLKPGIPDKQFFSIASSFVPWLSGIFALLVLNSFSRWLLKRSFRIREEHGLKPGFANNIAFSVLLHLVILSLIMIIPAVIKRQNQKKESDRPQSHYSPENVEYYFIDPNLPDEVQGLNGGVITGTETPNTNVGEKLPNEKPSDEGRVKGDVKRIRGKKLPPTYSNYISAKMRAFESFMEYWKTAPRNYSCVVAYTITPEGEVVDVELIENSPYPEQDRRTLELIENLSPMMPPPDVKGYVRVTELFWNGSINPESMPTNLQSDLVQMFDGRYMEEL